MINKYRLIILLFRLIMQTLQGDNNYRRGDGFSTTRSVKKVRIRIIYIDFSSRKEKQNKNIMNRSGPFRICGLFSCYDEMFAGTI